MPNYELTYILRPLEEANLTALNERVNTILKNAGGEIVARNDWGRRRLAYPIRKINDGYYSTLFVTLPGTSVRGVERALQLIDDVQRYLMVRVEEFRMPAAPPAEVPAQPEASTAAVESAPASTVAVESAPASTVAIESAPASAPPPAETPVTEPPVETGTAPVVAAEGS